MRPTPIPDAEIWEGAQRRIISPPNGDLLDPDIAPVEALIDVTELGPRFSMRCVLEHEDLDVLRSGGVVWVSMLGDQLQPFQIQTAGAVHPGVSSLRLDVSPGESEPLFEAFMYGVDGVNPKLFVAGCIEALKKMLAEAD